MSTRKRKGWWKITIITGNLKEKISKAKTRETNLSKKRKKLEQEEKKNENRKLINEIEM